uniref:PABS domain-containing protein n=1 Tax=Acrobeloides nanus TaxID=290746 RepID=A0A914DXD8_9BILA
MTAVSFITYALAQNHSGNLLMIGLGGSSLNNFLAQFSGKLNITVVELNPAMKFISTRWFDLQESSSHHVIIDDGVKYLEDNIKNPLKFDIIFLDACFNMLTNGTVCPVDVFQEENTIRMIQQNLGTHGILTMNVAISREDDENFLKNVS